MDFLIAKVTKSNPSTHYKVISDHTTFQFNVDEYSLIEYSPDHNLDEDSLFKVSNFTKKNYCLDLLKKEILSADFNNIPDNKYKDVLYLCAVQKEIICFQKVTPSTYLKRAILTLRKDAIIEESNNKILINSFPDAVFIPKQNILVFKKLSTISGIFEGMNELYKEATNEEVEAFFNQSFFALDGNYNVSKVGKLNRKRITFAKETFDKLGHKEKEEIINYIHQYCKDIQYNEQEKKFSISTDSQLKSVLYGIQERFYTTNLGGEKRLANSIQKLS